MADGNIFLMQVNIKLNNTFRSIKHWSEYTFL